MPGVMRNDTAVFMLDSDDIDGIHCIPISQESIVFTGDQGGDFKYQSVCWWILISLISDSEYMAVEIIRLFGGASADIIDIYLDDDPVISDS